jgi:NAD(P)-dependent dehydrogenase (short-subunit alcohol dehydrogenase family)
MPRLGTAWTSACLRRVFDLSGKVALITGGSRGLGLGFATGIARCGGDLVLWGRGREQNEAAAERLREFGVRVLPMQVDVSEEEQVVRGAREAVAELGRIDCVIPNAGINTRAPSFVALDSAMWHDLHAINLHGVYFTLREVLRHMVERSERGDPGGSVITMGSLTVTQGRAAIQHYGAAKGVVSELTRAIAVEYARHGIRANMVLPGRFQTGLGGAKALGAQEVPEALPGNPIPRRGVAADLQGIAAYLMSDASSYHTGDLITVDGGRSIIID